MRPPGFVGARAASYHGFARRACAAAGAALLVAACSSAAQSPTPGAGPARAVLARQYLAIAVAGNHRLETDFDGLKADQGNLAAARAYLRDAAATERLFDRRLLRLSLTPPVEKVARLLVAANEARARLAAHAAESASLDQLRGYERMLTAANAPVEDGVRVIRSMLGLPPPETS